MHIGLFAPAWPATAYPNGVVTYVHHLRTELLNQGHRVSVFTALLGAASESPGIYLVEPTSVQRARSRLAKWFRGSGVFGFGNAIAARVNDRHRSDPLDVFEMEETFGWCADVQRLVPVPVVVKLHGPAFLTLVEVDRRSKRGRLRIESEGNALRRMAAIVSPSARTLESTLSRYGLTPRIRRVIPNPVAGEPGIEPWRLEDCDRKAILFVGRFDLLKGGDTALIAFRRLLELDGDLTLIFVGPDSGLVARHGGRVFFDAFRDSLFTATQAQRVRYLGKLPRSDIPALRRKAMLTLVASRWENQPNTVLEAMSQGCPIVAPDTGGIGEIIQDGVNGLLARREDIDDLCEKMTRVLRDPLEAQRLGANARRYVAERRSARDLVMDAVGVYDEAVALARAAAR